MKKSLSLVLLLGAIIFSIYFNFSSVSADTIKVLPTGTYTLNVSYYTDENATTESKAMNSYWSNSAKLVVNSNNQAKLIFSQSSGMSMMTSASFAGHKLGSSVSGDTGTWSVNLTPQEAIGLVNGNTYLSNITYQYASLVGNHDFYVKINSGVPDSIDQPGEYQLAVKYNKYLATATDGDSGEASMIQDGGLWDDNITYQLKNDGTAELTLTQAKMMDYMSYLSFDGTEMISNVDKENSENGTWTATIAASTVKKLVDGGKIIAKMTYSVPGMFTHTVDTVVVIESKMLVKADPLVTTAEVNPNSNTDASTSADINKEASTESNIDTESNVDSSTSVISNSKSNTSESTGNDDASVDASENTQTASNEIAKVKYNQVDDNDNDLNTLSMIETDGIWDPNIKIKKNSDGTITVTITQNKMMNYMTTVKFDGIEMTKNSSSTNATSGTWTAILSKEKAADIKVGNKILLNISYTIPNMFTHNVKALAIIESLATTLADDSNTNSQETIANNSNEKNDELAPLSAVGADNTANTKAIDNVATLLDTASANNKTLPQTDEENSMYATVLGLLTIISAVGLSITIFSVGRFRK